MIPIGRYVISSRNYHLCGIVVGYGAIEWPKSEGLNGDDNPQVVYLVKIGQGSSSLGPACAIFRADQIEERN